MNSNAFANRAAGGMDVAAVLQTLPHKSAPEGGWDRILERHAAGLRTQRNRRRYWGGGLAVAAGVAAAVISLRLGGGAFMGLPIEGQPGSPLDEAAVASNTQGPEEGGAFSAPGQVVELMSMDLDALVALSRFQEDRLRALPVAGSTRPGRILEVDAFGLATELEDQIALLDEGFIPVSLNSGDRSAHRSLLRDRALLMEELFWLRRNEAAQAGFIHADF